MLRFKQWSNPIASNPKNLIIPKDAVAPPLRTYPYVKDQLYSYHSRILLILFLV